MRPSSSERLRAVRKFEDLVSYLEDELDWPLGEHPFENLTFEYEPAELGLKDEKVAAGTIILQLRPLTSNQPWGIFFVEFPRKKLPVLVLRRILSGLVVKKRAASKKSTVASWHAKDLLFISAFGDEAGGERELAFAHFHEENGDKPVLRVLDWDGSDTPLKLARLDEVLRQKLAWVRPGESPDDWRERWSSAFKLRLNHNIRTAGQMAETLADLARGIRQKVLTGLQAENAKGPLRYLLDQFRKSLLHDLTDAGFADTYAQTVTYGLLSLAITKTKAGHIRSVAAGHLVTDVPLTSPFLRDVLVELLQRGGRKGGLDFDELGMHDVVEFLNSEQTDLPAILRDFGNKTRSEDPVIHFYEHFLAKYDKDLKVQRGVFYTPQPVVSYIVRSAHELLQAEFGLVDGLADTATWGDMLKRRPGLKLPPLTHEAAEDQTIPPDEPFVQILDIASGTATFLVEIIDVIYRTLKAKWKRLRLTDAQQLESWNEYVPKHLLPRLHGFEIMMAPYAIAHMKIGLKLAETGYGFGVSQRAQIYLTNALQKGNDKQATIIGFEALAQESEAVNKIKRSKRFTVIIGNPPYANYSANLSTEARHIVDRYRSFHGVRIRERNQLQFERNLQDDFVKFISVGQEILGVTGVGVLGYITNGTMLASPSLRGMRESLVKGFSDLFELNLHGGGNEIIAGAEDDENVFDIVQSVAIHLYVRANARGASQLSYAELLGSRRSKYVTLSASSTNETRWRRITPDNENCGFTPQDETSSDSNRRLDSVFVKFGAGIKTNRDAVAIGFDDESVIHAVREFDAKFKSQEHLEDYIRPLLYRPFDVRRIFYHEDLVASRSLPTMQHLISGPNIGLVCSSSWTTPERFSVGVSRLMIEMKAGTHDRGTTFFPLYRYQTFLGGEAERVHNLTPDFVREWCTATGTTFVPTGRGDAEKTTGPEDVLAWLLALFHSPEYRRRFRTALSQGFPMILLTSNLDLFGPMAGLGRELAAVHLLESPRLLQPTTNFIVGRGLEVEKVAWSQDTVWVDKAQTTGFRGVSEAAWNFYNGGYQVCEKWLKDRKGRRLSQADIVHYQTIVVAVTELIRLMKEIDEVIELHGGWAGAFQTAKTKAKATETIPFPRRVDQPQLEERYVTCLPLVALKAAAGAFSDLQHIDDDDFEWVAVDARHGLRPGMFVAQVVGKSMEPAIPDGAFCIFAAPVQGTRQGKTVLVQLRDQKDPETGERYTVKRYESEKVPDKESWRHARITLKPANHDFAAIELTGGEGDLTVIAEFIEVLVEPNATDRG